MKKRVLLLVMILVLSALVSSCAPGFGSGEGTVSEKEIASEGDFVVDEKIYVKDDSIYPQLTDLIEGEYIATFTTDKGVIKARFFPQYAPLAVENFITHANDGYYNGLKFHRVIEGFMIQTGDPEGTGMGGESIWGGTFEYEITPNLRHLRGALAMAHSSLPDSNGSQFYIVQSKDIYSQQFNADVLQKAIENQDQVISPEEITPPVTMKEQYPAPLMQAYIDNGGTIDLDFGYTVFGQVFEGMDIVDAIAAVEVDGSDMPVEDVIIEKIEITKYKK